jgi:asparaginyl-tRNA synthetase
MLKQLINKSLLTPRLVRSYTYSPTILPKTIRFQLLTNEVDKEITVKGWVKSVRKQKNLIFIELNDGSQFDNLQLILEADKLENVNTGTCLEVNGKLTTSPGKNQSKEVLINNLKVLGSCPTEVGFDIN